MMWPAGITSALRPSYDAFPSHRARYTHPEILAGRLAADLTGGALSSGAILVDWSPAPHILRDEQQALQNM